MSGVADFVVRAGGVVDVDATLQKFSEAVQDLLTEEEIRNGTVADAVNETLDAHPGAKFTVTSLTSFTLAHMSASPDQYPLLSEAIQGYIKSNSGTRESGAKFMVVRGKSTVGNVARWADVPEKTEK